MVRDTIERELVLKAPIDRVWAAITEPDQVSAWFGTDTEIEPRPGGKAIFGWEGVGRFHAVIEVMEPPRRFAFRWAHDMETPVEVGPTTLVTFTLEPHPDGTRLRLVESGFASLPDDVRDRIHSGNSEGWDEEMGDLARYLDASMEG